MKIATIILTLPVLVVIVPQDVEADLHETMHAEAEKCIVKTGGAPDALKKLKAGGDAVDYEIKCFGACVMKALKMIEGDGTMDAERAKASIPSDTPSRDMILATIDRCANEKGANECETAYAIFVCMHKHHT